MQLLQVALELPAVPPAAEQSAGLDFAAYLSDIGWRRCACCGVSNVRNVLAASLQPGQELKEHIAPTTMRPGLHVIATWGTGGIGLPYPLLYAQAQRVVGC